MVNSQRKIYISLTVFFIVLISLITFVAYPLFAEIKGSSEDFISEKEKLLLLQQEKGKFHEEKAVFENYDQDLEKLDKLFISPESFMEFVHFLEASAQNYQVEIEKSIKREEEGDPWGSTTFQISATGFFPSLLQFLERLQNAPYLIEILNLNIYSADKGEHNLIESNFLLRVFTT